MMRSFSTYVKDYGDFHIHSGIFKDQMKVIYCVSLIIFHMIKDLLFGLSFEKKGAQNCRTLWMLYVENEVKISILVGFIFSRVVDVSFG